MLESIIVNGHPWSIACVNSNPEMCGEDAALMSDLSKDVQNIILDWIFANIRPRKAPNYNHNSYQIKHQIESELGIYLSNNQLKDAMLIEGYHPVKENELNWVFCISQKSPAFREK